MDEVKRILNDDINDMNRREKRDNKIRFSTRFFRKHPYLFWGMLVCYIPVALILWHVHYFGRGYAIAATLFVMLMSFALSLHIRPRYRFEDIDQLDMRVCYNGEWYNKRFISSRALQQLLDSPRVSHEIKQELEHIQGAKGGVTFFDVFVLAYLQSASESM